jgi:ABC-type uncharacterized transport system permease subunit
VSRLRGWRTLAWAGVIVGLLAALVALPPMTVRTPLAPLLVGLFALTIGIGSWIRGERRVGGYAIGAGVIGGVVGYLATVSRVGKLETAVVWGGLFAAMLRYATPLAFAALGGLFSERSGVVNIGLEGMMLTGAFFAIWGSDVTSSWELGLIIAIGSGALMGLLHAFFSISLRADQIVGGTAINFLALGITTYLFIKLYGDEGTPPACPGEAGCLHTIPNIDLGFLGTGFIGDVFGNLNLMIWAAALLCVVVWLVVFKTPAGLRLRSVGEHPRAADTVGIDVYRVRYMAVTLSGMLAASGGAYLALAFTTSFKENMTAGRGFIALAALIFGGWRPFGAATACLLFGFSSALAKALQVYSLPVSVLFEALPYVLTLVAVAGVVGRSIPPASVGRPYLKQ